MNEEIATTQEQTLTIQKAFGLNVQHHKKAELPQVESIYQQTLATDPNQPDALHLLGGIAHQVSKMRFLLISLRYRLLL